MPKSDEAVVAPHVPDRGQLFDFDHREWQALQMVIRDPTLTLGGATKPTEFDSFWRFDEKKVASRGR